ncbi:hypothetical protein OG912_36375 [Streptomyces sp. NBC_00464]
MTEQHQSTAPNDPLHFYAAHSPDVVRSGSLQNAVQAECHERGEAVPAR